LFKPTTDILTEPLFDLHSSQTGATLVVAATGEIDMATAPELAQAIDAGSAVDSVRSVVVDLSRATFLDSSALNSLVHAQRTLAEREIAFRVVSPSDETVRRVFEITKLVGPLGLVDSLDDALA
jgi:anti-sigma B factor antagonist